MTAYLDLVSFKRLLVWGQVLLLSSIFSLPSYAVDAAVDNAASSTSDKVLVDTATALGLPEEALTAKREKNTNAEASAAENNVEAESASEPVKPPPVISGESTNNAQIETTPTPQKDNDIRQRINGIFSEIEGLHDISVSVTQGVVTLTGETPNEKKAQQAINLTNRLTDVVTVEDKINRTLDVQDNVTTVYQGLKAQFKTLLKAMPLILVGIVIFALITWFGSWLSNRKTVWQRLTPNPFVAELLSQTIKVVFIVIGLILALSLVGAETILSTLLGGAGVIGLAVGFAVKDSIENYIASLLLSIRQPFRARDQIVINDKEGIVVRLTSRATILMTLDGNQLRIPNAEVFKATILNYTKNPERRFTFELGVDANDDPLAAIKVGLDAICTLDFVLDKPKATAIITNVGDSNIILQFLVWVDQTQTDYYKARSITIRETKHSLENEGFTLPEPIYKVRFNHKVEKAFEHMQTVSGMPTSEITVEPTTPEQTQSAPKTKAVDDDDKKQAKARARQILQGEDADEVLDARPDEKLKEKVEQEIADRSGEADLLNHNSPQE